MSLFSWSTPERQKDGQILLIIPNEIYLYIFEFLASPTKRLTLEELEIFTRLSRVCRFFANVCLPRIFEFVEFSGSMFPDDTPTGLHHNSVYQPSRESTLCAQIAAKQPLALALAERVRECRFTNWQLDNTGAWAVRLFVNKYIKGLSHMKNVRELTFTDSFVDAQHWRAIAALDSLELLSFDTCRFLPESAEVKPGKMRQVAVSRLQVLNCEEPYQLVAAIDPRCLHTLAADVLFFDRVDWIPQWSLTELHFHLLPWQNVSEELPATIAQAPKSLETLLFSLDSIHGVTGVAEDVVHMVFDNPTWRTLPSLHSIIWQFTSLGPGIFVSPSFDDEIRRTLHDDLGPASRLKYVNVYGKVFHLVDGEWSRMSRIRSF